ncbi:MAG: 1-deoxy-D-xylulose-5-phosphate synthase, partial [Clostridia bacterium]|nr:1-deoxy-D-xylulose-5-phosphate synthase [Clostridia bacterium]
PERYFDVGIAEQHAVTMASGLAMTGFVPVIPLYSTFMQRAYDQILHDVCLQNLHVVLCADRAGIVGQDGETHQGMYDIAFLSSMPNMTILSPSSFKELDEMMEYAINKHNGPITIRYPRGCMQEELACNFEPGKTRLVRDGEKIVIFSTGRMLKTAKSVAEKLNAKLVALPTIFPLNADEISEHTTGASLAITIEDGIKTGGLGSLISTVIAESENPTKMLICAFPDVPITHGSVSELDKYYNMDEESIIKRIEEKL